MEITLEAIISLLGLFVGGGGGCFFTWRWMNRRAKAEAKEKEAEAKSAEVAKTLKKQAGAKKVETNLKDQTVIVTFSAEENTVSNLLKQFKQMGVTAAAMETGCFGSKEGCINAIKPDNLMK